MTLCDAQGVSNHPKVGWCFHLKTDGMPDHTVSYDGSVHMIWDPNKMK